MTKYYTIICNGIQGKYYRTKEEAQIAADLRHTMTGRRWEVKEVWLRDEYADDDRPYRAVKKG